MCVAQTTLMLAVTECQGPEEHQTIASESQASEKFKTPSIKGTKSILLNGAESNTDWYYFDIQINCLRQ